LPLAMVPYQASIRIKDAICDSLRDARFVELMTLHGVFLH